MKMEMRTPNIIIAQGYTTIDGEMVEPAALKVVLPNGEYVDVSDLVDCYLENDHETRL
jgi:hypothetical protein